LLSGQSHEHNTLEFLSSLLGLDGHIQALRRWVCQSSGSRIKNLGMMQLPCIWSSDPGMVTETPGAIAHPM
jgi:hypothetical protein